MILITIDGLRADHLSALGYDKKNTPEIDKDSSELGNIYTSNIK